MPRFGRGHAIADAKMTGKTDGIFDELTQRRRVSLIC